MAKFDIVRALQGKRAERIVPFPGTDVRFGMRPLTGAEESEVVAGASAYAKARSSDEAKRGDPLFDIAEMAHALARACVDLDSPEDARAPFFASAEQVLEHVQRETIAYLYELLEQWAAACSPFRHQLTAVELLEVARKEAASVDDRLFIELPPHMRWSFTHILACLLVRSPEAQSLLSSLCATPTETSHEHV